MLDWFRLPEYLKQLGMARDKKYLLATYPEQVDKYWDVQKNAGINPSNLTIGSHVMVKWRCAECSHRWSAPVNNICNSWQKGRTGCAGCAGTKHLGKDDYQKLAKQNGWRWVGEKLPKSNKAQTEWHCDKHEHAFQTFYNRMQSQGTGCEFCGQERSEAAAERIRLSVPDYGQLGTEKGWRWLGPEVRGNKQKTNWLCTIHGPFPSAYNWIQNGNGCPECGAEKVREHARSRRLTPADYHALAKQYGWTWLGPAVTNNRTNTVWLCSEGHRVTQPYDKMQGRQSCMECSGLAPKSKSDYAELAKDIGYVFKGPLPDNSRKATYWDCDNGHVDVDMTYASLRAGQRCRHCKFEHQAERQRLKEDDYNELARSRGIEWVGVRLPKNKDEPTLWHCLAGHDNPDWPASYGSIRGTQNQPGSGCPTCANHGIDLNSPGVLYYVRVETRNQLFWKIGITNRTVLARFPSDLWKITVIRSWPFEVLRDGYKKEQRILREHSLYRYKGPEAPLTGGGNKELFTADVLKMDLDYSAKSEANASRK